MSIFKSQRKETKLELGELYSFFASSGALALFDPDVFNDRLSENVDWFLESHYCELIEVQRGDCALLGLKPEEIYRICLRQDELTHEEKAFAKFGAYMGLKVVSGCCWVGDEKQYQQVVLPSGEYDLRIYGLDFSLLDTRFVTMPDLALKERLADIVILIQNRESVFEIPLEDDIMFENRSKRYLFDSVLRKEIIAKHKAS